MNSVTDHIRDPIVIIKALVAFLILSGVFALIPLIYSMLEEQLTPIDYWFKYHSIEPAKDSFCVGEDLRFFSHRDIYRETDMQWHDALYCDLGDSSGFGTYSIYDSGRFIEPEHDLIGHWTYQARIPVEPAICYLHTSITAKLKYSSKTQYVIGPEFKIEDCS